jgi:hypothetical protein
MHAATFFLAESGFQQAMEITLLRGTRRAMRTNPMTSLRSD